MNNIMLETPHLSAEISIDQGLSLLKLVSFGKTLFEGQAPLMEVTCLRLADGEIIKADSESGWKNAVGMETPAGAVFTLSGYEAFPELAISLTAQLDQEKSAIYWTGAVVGAPDSISIREISYPRVTADVQGEKELFYAKGPGQVIAITPEADEAEDNNDWEMDRYRGYPSFGPAMQFMAFYDKKEGIGLYYGVHDPDAAYKKFMYKAAPNLPFWMEASYPAEGFTEKGNTFSLSGRMVWQALQGDWYDAARIYREFVWKEARWIPDRYDENGLLKQKRWANEIPHWWLCWAGDSVANPSRGKTKFADFALEAEKDLGVPSAIHLYDYYDHHFDDDYPHFVPLRPFATESIRRLREAGMKVMPYINGWLWDTHDRGDEDYQYSAIAKPAVIRRENGELYLKKYGSGAVMARMCPSTTVWQQKVPENCDTLVNHVGVDGVYLDQIASGSPRFCCDKHHNHRPGGGKWWVESYNQIIESCRRAVGDQACLTSESNAEPYLRNLDVFLSWTNMWKNQVPAFAAVYGGSCCFGRCYQSLEQHFNVGDRLFEVSDNENLGVRILCTQALVFGEEIGWIRPQFYLSMGAREYYKKIVHIRWDYNDYFVDGEMLRPPFVPMERTVSAKLQELGWFDGINERPVVTGLWKNQKTGKMLLIAANITNETQQTTMESPYFEKEKMDVTLAPEEVLVRVLD